jgi:hypothetical protein
VPLRSLFVVRQPGRIQRSKRPQSQQLWFLLD